MTLSDIDRKGLILSSKFYEKVFKAAVYVSAGTFLVEMLLGNFLKIFRLLSDIFQAFVNSFSAAS